MKKIYLFIAILGIIAPYYFIYQYYLNYGMDFSKMLELIFSNSASSFIAADLAVSGLVFLIFMTREAKRVGMPYWPYYLAVISVGVSFAFPLFMYFREDKVNRAK